MGLAFRIIIRTSFVRQNPRSYRTDPARGALYAKCGCLARGCRENFRVPVAAHLGEVDDSYVKVAKVKGSLTWRSHEREDELFLVLRGILRIEMEHASVE